MSKTPLARIREGELAPVYVLAGEERFTADQLLAAIRQTVSKTAIVGLNEDVVSANETTPAQVLSLARTLPMMAPRRLVIVRGIERWDAREGKADDGLEKLGEYLGKPSPSTVLVLVGEKVDKRRKWVNVARQAGFLIECNPFRVEELPRFIKERADELSAPLESGACELLVELVGSDLSALTDAMERLSLYVGQGQPITQEAVLGTIARLQTASVWELLGALGRRDAGAAIAILDDVYDGEDRGLRLLGVLVWSTRQLLRFEAATRRGASPPDAAKAAGAPPFKARDLAEQVRRIPRAELERWLELLAALDLNLKGATKRPPKATLEHAILSMSASKTAGILTDSRRRPIYT